MARAIKTGIEYQESGSRGQYPWGDWLSQEGLGKGECAEVTLVRHPRGEGYDPSEHFPSDVKHFTHMVGLTAKRLGVKVNVSMSDKGQTCTIRVFKTTAAEAEALQAEYSSQAEKWKKKRQGKSAASNGVPTEDGSTPTGSDSTPQSKKDQKRQRKLHS